MLVGERNNKDRILRSEPYTTLRSWLHSSACDDVDMDECASNNEGCSGAATCTNTPGSFACTCLPGFTGDGFTCEGKSDYNSHVLPLHYLYWRTESHLIEGAADNENGCFIPIYVKNNVLNTHATMTVTSNVENSKT